MQANELMNTWIENSKAAIEPLRALGEVNRATLEAVAKQQVAVTKDYMEYGARNLQMMTSLRDPRTLVNEQLSLAKEFGDKLIANSETYAKMAAGYQAEVVAWTEKTAGEAVSKAEKVVQKAA